MKENRTKPNKVKKSKQKLKSINKVLMKVT